MLTLTKEVIQMKYEVSKMFVAMALVLTSSMCEAKCRKSESDTHRHNDVANA